MRRGKGKIECIIILFLISGIFINPIFENIIAKINSNKPVEQLPSINNTVVVYNIEDILVNNSTVYCNFYHWYLSVFDFSNPKERANLGEYNFNNYDWDSGKMFMYGKDLCFINPNNLTFIDISQPTNLTKKNVIPLNLTNEYFDDIKIKNNLGFIGGWSSNGIYPDHYINGSLKILDLDNLTCPFIGEYQNNKLVWDIAITGNYAFIMDSNNNKEINGFEIINISDPEIPIYVSEWNGICHPTDIEVVDDYVFLTTYDEGLFIIDVSDPSNPHRINVYDKIPYLSSIFCVEDLAYITYEKGLLILDISNTESISKVGKKRIFFEGHGFFTHVVVEDDIAYTLRWTEFEGREIFTFDVSDPSHPKKLFPAGIRISPKTIYNLMVYLFFFGLPVVIISAIVIPIVVVRKRKKKRKEELKEQVKEMQQKPSEEEETPEESIAVERP